MNHPHIDSSEFAFLGNVNALALGVSGARLLQKAFDGTISPAELAVLKQTFDRTPPVAE